MIIRKAEKEDIPAINRLASEIWWPTYKGIISDDQISFMLNDIYSEDSLNVQMNEGIKFLLAENERISVGFASYMALKDRIRIPKLYILPSEQGKGIGKLLLEHIANEAHQEGIGILELNVNRGNPALDFYKRLGFEIEETVDIPYYQFVLNDYVMRKKI